jgi:hypothetical protein
VEALFRFSPWIQTRQRRWFRGVPLNSALRPVQRGSNPRSYGSRWWPVVQLQSGHTIPTRMRPFWRGCRPEKAYRLTTVAPNPAMLKRIFDRLLGRAREALEVEVPAMPSTSDADLAASLPAILHRLHPVNG